MAGGTKDGSARAGDLERLAALEAQTRDFLVALERALPPVRSLERAGYAGADAIALEISTAVAAGSGTTGTVATLLQALEDARLAGGDRGALHYYALERRHSFTVDEVADAILERLDEGAPVLEAYLAYREKLSEPA